MCEPHFELIHSHLSGNLNADIGLFQKILNADINADSQFRRFRAGKTEVCLVYIEGMASDRKIGEFILHACAELSENDAPDADALTARVLEVAQCEAEGRVEAILKSVVTGMTALLAAGSKEALLLETRGFPARPVGSTTNESVVLGAQEGFVESLRTNITLIRRYVPSPHLITEALSVGRAIPSQVSLIYLEGVTEPGVVDALRARIKGVDAPAVVGIGELQQLIEDCPGALLPQMLQTERPDRAAACLMEGQAVLLQDNSPYALAAPVSLFHQLHASDDAFARWQYGSFLRLIRFAGMLISVFLPGLYLALTEHHMHLIPMSLLTSIAEARASVPFPILTEILIMEFSFYLINEAGTRMPNQIGSALGIVGALILGQAAVSASIISPILIIIVALTGLGNYAVPDYGFGLGLTLYRLSVIAAAALFGLYGICAAAFCIVTELCGMRSLGAPYLAPVAPPRPHNPDLLGRAPAWLQRRRAAWAQSPNWMEARDA